MIKKQTVVKTAFDKYIIIEKIGQGGSGTVFKAQNTDGENFALKFINTDTSSKEKIKRFKNEINFCYKTEHKNIVKVIDYGVYENDNLETIFYVMPYYESNLRNKIKETIPANKRIDTIIEILHGLKYAHNKGIWHRDLKPENILCDSELKHVVIADWGIAHFCEDFLSTTVETGKASRLANFTYAAPEQRIKGEKVGPQADIYAAGLILNEMFTKKVVAGANYLKISDVDSTFGFLDELVENMITQDANNRIFPIDKLLLNLAMLTQINDYDKELEKIIQEKIEEDSSEDDLFNGVNIKDIKYENSKLEIYLDKKVNEQWCRTLLYGNYNYGSVLSTPREAFNYRQTNESTIFSVIVSHESSLESIVTYFKDWLQKATSLYKHNVLEARQQAYKEAIRQQKLLQQKTEKEKEINIKLKALI